MGNRFRGCYTKEDIGKVKLFLRSVAEGGSDVQNCPTVEQISELLRKAMLMLDDLSEFHYGKEDKQMHNFVVYIAGPISDCAGNAKENFKKAEENLLKVPGNAVINPMRLPAGLSQESYMDICLAMVRACDAIYMLSGWDNSLGAKTEHALAKKLDKNIIYQGEEW